MYVPRAMYSLRMSFWIVPRQLSAAIPRSSATTMYIASSVAAVALMVIDVDTLSSGIGQQRVHVVHRVDRHADAAHLAQRTRRVGVEAHLGGQVERHREPGLPRLEQQLEPPVGLVRGAEAGVLAHGPQARRGTSWPGRRA